jgi:hypothetical protein
MPRFGRLSSPISAARGFLQGAGPFNLPTTDSLRIPLNWAEEQLDEPEDDWGQIKSILSGMGGGAAYLPRQAWGFMNSVEPLGRSDPAFAYGQEQLARMQRQSIEDAIRMEQAFYAEERARKRRSQSRSLGLIKQRQSASSTPVKAPPRRKIAFGGPSNTQAAAKQHFVATRVRTPVSFDPRRRSGR